MSDRLDLPRRYRDQIEALLHEHVPGVAVWAYGSRVTGESHDASDLDLVLRGPDLKWIPSGQLADLNAALEDSNVPIIVQVHDWARLPESFHREIERAYVVLVEDTSGDSVGRDWLYHPQFPEHWKRKPLYSMAQWVNGLAFRKIQFSPTGKPVIKIAEIKGGISGQTKFTQQSFDESVYIRPGDLLFSWSGQPETSIDAFWWRGPEGWLNQHIFRVTPDPSIDTTFFYYLLRYLKPNFIGIARNKQTTGLGHVTKQDLEHIEAALPPLSEQRAIAHILGTLDDKIELNRRMNETLEEMARALFKSWFVDFDPVRAKMEGRDPGLPKHLADLFPDRLVDSELGPIPEGWEVSEIGREVEVVGGSTPSTKEPAFWEKGNIHWATPKDLSRIQSPVLIETDRKITNAGLQKISSGLLPVGTVLMSSRAPIGYLAIAQVPLAVNQGFIAMKCSERISKEYTLSWCYENMDIIKANATGTTFQEISKRNFRPLKVIVPTTGILKVYDSIVSPLFEKITLNVHESHILAAQRDALLPKLVSGEMRVDESAP